ncbi:hypothetical protein GU243_23925 (plasmid) [Pseudarthrobacter psychrotolerans]|uniref:Uncharacterized protein n=1 Tax=Pseudarthrobacter psychrotolerans TaxID=2697569 RepID=A0A6P1NPJ4_9MICC|nr:hypothetical protein [Pseudarthrobacter psychrotolerans]QHK22615.1 hypothetical protein GU243_23925 [Pseudarthrobacter psychrotolerans]
MSKRVWILPTALGVAGLLIGSGLGFGFAPAVPAEGTPASCIEALALADEGIGANTAILRHAADALTATSDSDFRDARNGIDKELDRLASMSDRYESTKHDCREGARP